MTTHFDAMNEELRQIRDALAEAVERKSLRSVARDVGMSPTGLRGLIDGADPYVKTWEKIRLWFAEHAAEKAVVPPATAVGVLRALMRGIPESARTGAQVRVLKGFEEAFHFAGVPAPEWLTAASAALHATGSMDAKAGR